MGGQEGVETFAKTRYLTALAIYRLIQSSRFKTAYEKNPDPNVYKMVTVAEIDAWINNQFISDLTQQPIKVLRAKAASLRVDNYWRLDKQELLEAIQRATSSSEQNRSSSN